ncbi:hypothetical protein ACFQX6_07490 [Streptosporangium lutulentum]
MIVVGIWTGMPQTTVVLLAGLQSVPKELYEAATWTGPRPSGASGASRCRSCARSS